MVEHDELNQRGATLIPFVEEEDTEETDDDAFLNALDSDLPGAPLVRFRAYQQAWEACFKRMKEILHALRNPVVEGVLQAIYDAYDNSQDRVILPEPELSTILISGSDRTYLQDCLTQVLMELGSKERHPAIVSRITESDCSNLTSMIKALVLGFLNHPLTKPLNKKLRGSTSLANHDIYLLRPWYRAVQQHYGDEAPSLVVLVQDLHAIDPTVLRDFLEICSCHIPYVPLSIVMGTFDSNYLASVLPRITLSYLRIERFNLTSDVKTLEYVIKETFFDIRYTPPVMLGPKAIEILFGGYQTQNATFDSMFSTLQLLYLQHFYNPLSVLADPSNDPAIRNTLDSSDSWKPFMKLLRQRCLADGPPTQEEWEDLLPGDVLTTAIQSRNLFQDRMANAKVAFHLLVTGGTHLQGRGLKGMGVSFQKAAIAMLEGNAEDIIQNVCQSIRLLELFEAQALVEDFYPYINTLPNALRPVTRNLKSHIVNVINGELTKEMLEGFLKFFADYLKKTIFHFDDILCVDVWWTGEHPLPNSPFNPNPHLSIVTSLLRPQMYLGWGADEQKSVEEDPASFPDVCTLFRRYLESGRMINVYDWYQSFAVTLEDDEDSNVGDNDMAVDEASPQKNIEPESTPTKRKRGRPPKATKQPTPPPVSLSKKAKAIPSEGQGQEDKDKDTTQELQARFLRAINELEFAGFLKHTGRKADHVLKTVFDPPD